MTLPAEHRVYLRQTLGLHSFFMLLTTALLLSFSINSAFAQITKTARIELSDSKDKVYIGTKTYVTPDSEERLTYKVITSRHQNNLRGARHNSNIINLGLKPSPSWLVFSVTNNSSSENWFLDFGNMFEGRFLSVKNISVHNATNNTRRMESSYNDAKDNTLSQNTLGKNLIGTAVPLTIKKGKTELFVIYLEADGLLPHTISPSLVNQDTFERSMIKGTSLSLISAAFLFGIAVFFATISYTNKKPEYLLFSAFFLINLLQMNIINATFFSLYDFTPHIMASIYVATIIMALALSRSFLNIKAENNTENMLIFVTGGLLILGLALSILVFESGTFLYSAFIMLPSALGLIIISYISFTLGQKGHYAAHYYASGWIALIIGSGITALTAAGLFHTSFLTLNAYWLSLLPQALLFAAATTTKLNLINEEQRSLEARENRAAQSLARLKQSKESADQARLLRVIERERELMAELREREIQRTEEMRYAKEAADEANRAKSAFLAVVSHEIRTPMTGIMGIVSLFMDTKLNKEQKDFILAIQTSGDTMLMLLNDILDFEKIQTKNMVLEEIDFNLRKLVRDVITLMSAHAADRGIILLSDIPDDFPSFLIGDPTRLRQVLLNLVNNALKFTEKGHVTIKLNHTKIEKKNDRTKGDYEIYVAVEDTGIGISKEAQSGLFDPFSQADTNTTRKYGGTGLGLAICQSLIEAMGGVIQISSEENTGSTFFFSILMDESLDGDMGASSRKIQISALATPQMKVLIVEDNEINRKVLKSFLEKDGHKSVLAASAEQAIELAQTHQFDAIFMDINLSGMNGVEATKIIRSFPNPKIARIPIIAITGNFSDEHIATYYEAGINAYISKPIDYNLLLKALSDIHMNTLPNPLPEDIRYPAIADKNREIRSNIPNDEAQEVLAESSASPPITPKEEEEEEKEEGKPPIKESPSEPVNETPPLEKAELNNLDDIAQNSKDLSFGGDYIHEEHENGEKEGLENQKNERNEALKKQAGALSFDDHYDDIIDAETSVADGENLDKIFDRNMMQSLLDTLGKEQVAELMNGCLDKADAIVLEIQQAGEGIKLQFLREKSHELKGMAANFGMNELAALSGRIEDTTEKDDLDTALKETKRLPDAKYRARTAVEQWLKEGDE